MLGLLDAHRSEAIVSLRIALLLLWPIGAIGNLFVALANVTIAPTGWRHDVGDVLLFIGSTFVNQRWHLAFDISRRPE
jgi:hypothetical protein